MPWRRLTREPGEGGANRWAAVPLGATVTASFDEVANQRLTFEMAVDEEMELTGPVTLSLSFSSNEIDSYVVVRTGLVSADGAYGSCPWARSAPPAAGSMRRAPPPRRSPSTSMRPEPLAPGVPVRFASA